MIFNNDLTSRSEAHRRILHVDMDAFYVSVELLFKPELKGTPVIVGGRPPRGVVSTCSYEARKYGIHSGMASVQAERLCPFATWLQGNFQAYAEYSKRVFEIMRRYSPEVVQVSVDEGRVDLTGSEPLFGPAESIAHRILTEIRTELGLPASAGLANSPTVAKIASEIAKPAGLAVILPGYERQFLAPLRVERIPGVGKKSLPKFHSYGIYTIGDIASRPDTQLQKQLGLWSGSLKKIALGVSSKPLRHTPASPSRSHEQTYSENLTDLDQIRMELRKLIERLGYKLRGQKFRAKTICVKIRDGNFQTINRSSSFHTPANSDRILFHAAWDIVKANLPKGGIRLLGVSAQNLCADGGQLNLFESNQNRLLHFYHTVDSIKNKYGKKIAGFGLERKKTPPKQLERY